MKALLAAVVAVGLTAVAGAVIVGMRVSDGTVVENPYERGIAWDREREARALSGLEVSVVGRSFRTGDNLVSLRVLDGGTPFAGESVTVLRTRPATSAHDRTFSALRGGDGVFRTAMNLPLPGRWDLVVGVEGENGSFRFRRAVYAGEVPPAEAPCDLDRGPCVTVLQPSGTELAFDVTPRPIRTMTTLEFTVALAASDAPEGEVTVSLSMPGMYMGENVLTLLPAGEGLWKGEGVVVRCPRGGRSWRAEIAVPERGAAAIGFEVDR